MPLDPGSRILITAGGAGIGRAMGEAFAQAGARVWVTDVDADALAACPQDWRKTHSDASDEGAMAALFAEIELDCFDDAFGFSRHFLVHDVAGETGSGVWLGAFE